MARKKKGQEPTKQLNVLDGVRALFLRGLVPGLVRPAGGRHRPGPSRPPSFRAEFAGHSTAGGQGRPSLYACHPRPVNGYVP